MGTRVYNNLPKSLKEINDYKVFKKEFKIFNSLNNCLQDVLDLTPDIKWLSDYSRRWQVKG